MASIGLMRMVVMGWAVLCGLGWGLPGCGEASVPAGFERVTIDGRDFVLELAADNASRELGLSHRDSIPETGGMLFAFPNSARRAFVMRHCVIPIDILFLDGTGRIVAMHAMEVERPQGEDESDFAYNLRLRQYSSRFGAQFAVELQGGMLEQLDVEVGDRIELDIERLKRTAR
jgi:uncharacterized membrane protein (UPF0127 family)